jgi:hypothetical protein
MSTMLTPGHQLFIEADVAYRRDRIMAELHRSRSDRRTRTGWLHGLIEAIRGNGDPRHGASRLDPDGSLISAGRGFAHDPRAMAAPHHASSTC